MLQVTIKRLHGLGEVGEPIVVCNVDHRFIVAEQLHQIGVRNPTIILEPESKNTAPAIALAAFYALNNIKDKDVVLLILSADHIIENSKSFYRAVDVGCKQAVDEKIVTFGVFPKNPNTGYGYIKGEVCDESSALYRVNDFVEKPSLLDANKYIEDGTYFWNSGIFMFQAKVLIQELAKYSKEIVDAAQQSINESVSDLDFVRVGCSAFKKSPSDSIDYALMEKTGSSPLK